MSTLFFRCRHAYPGGAALEAEFSLGAGVTALFGPSGCGKTTTLKLIAGLLRPAEGKIALGDLVLCDTKSGVFLPPDARQLGVVFQEHRLFPHLTVAQNLKFGQPPGVDGTDFKTLVELLELPDFLNRYPNDLSGGQQRRVALGRAILRRPRLLLMDEPLTGLEADLKQRILHYLDRVLARWEIPTLFISHDQAEVRRIAKHVVIMDQGRIVEAGPTTSTLDHAVTHDLLSQPGPINLIRFDALERIGDQIVGKLGETAWQLPADAADSPSPLYLFFLPSDVTLSLQPTPHLSIRNQVPGTVRDVVTMNGRVFVSIDTGTPIWAEITGAALRKLGLSVGSPVVCLIKTSALKVLPA